MSQKLGLLLVHSYCECRDIYPRTVIYKYNLFTIPAQSEQKLYVWTEHACKRPPTCERVRYVWIGPPTNIGHSTSERDYSPWQCLKALNTMPFHIPWHTSPGHTIAHTMWCPPGHSIYHALAAKPYNISYIMHAHQAIPYTIHCSPGHTIHQAMPARPYHIQYQAQYLTCQTITIYNAMTARPYHIPCNALQAILNHAMPARPYHIDARPTRHTIIPCDARQAVLYTMRGPPGHTKRHAMPARPYHIPQHAR